jgi:protein SCO1
MRQMRLLFLLLNCLFALQPRISAAGDSLYALHVTLTRQDAQPAGFDLYRGHPVMVSMFYGSCGYVCPTLIARLHHLENSLDAPARAQLRVLLVSIDPAHDTPEVLMALAENHHADAQRWTLARAEPADVRKIAALVGVQYRQLPDGSFNHSVLVTLLDAQGVPLARSAKLSGEDAEFTAALRAATAP